MSPIINGMLAHNMTQPLATAKPFPFPPDPQWGPGDIGTIVFGCLASVLGIFTIWATFWLGRRGALRTGGNDESRETEITDNEDLPLEDIVVERGT